jgi:hypothetical protein
MFSYTQTSDRVLKTNIASIKNPLEKVLAIRGKYFNWKTNHDGLDNTQREIGVFAQDVQQVLPEAVVSTGSSLAVKYTALIPLVIEAIREINNKMILASGDMLEHSESVTSLEEKLKSLIESHEVSKRRISQLEETVRILQIKVK